MSPTPFVPTVLLSAAIGAVVFGVGGRIAMRVYALREWQEPYFTVSGTMTVVVIATVAGAAIGAWLWLGNRLFLSGLPEARGYRRPVMRQLFFWTGLILLSLRVLAPLSQSRMELFSPLVALHGVTLLVLSRRLSSRGPTGYQSIVWPPQML